VNPGTPPASGLDAALRRVRNAVLATLAVSAIVIATTAASSPAPAPASGFPMAAIAFGLAAVFAHHAAAAMRSRGRVALALASLLLPAGVGLVGVVLALQGGSRGTALAYVLGGALLCLRPTLRPLPR
jgi:hypothetical protein